MRIDGSFNRSHFRELQLKKYGRLIVIVNTCKRGSAAVVRTICCSYGKHQILHLFRAETTEPINTNFWTIDYLGNIKEIAKFGSDQFKGSVSPSGWNIQYPVFSSGLLWSDYRPQFATDFDVLWLKRFGLAQGCAFWVFKVLKFIVRGLNSPKSGSVGKSQLKIPYFVFLSTACTLGKSYINSVHMYLFVFNSPTRLCTIYAGRIYSFGDNNRFATPNGKDRSARSVS